MPDDVHPADKAIGADWQMPLHVLHLKSWDTLDQAERDRLNELRREGWLPRWDVNELEGEAPEAIWIQLELHPPDPRDPRPVEKIGPPWPYKLVLDEEKRVNAIVEEHREDL